MKLEEEVQLLSSPNNPRDPPSLPIRRGKMPNRFTAVAPHPLPLSEGTPSPVFFLLGAVIFKNSGSSFPRTRLCPSLFFFFIHPWLRMLRI